MPIDNKKPWVVVTGGNSGIGLATIIALLKCDKYNVISTQRNKVKIHGTVYVEMDLSDEDSIVQAADTIKEISHCKLKGLFHNAGYGLQVALEDVSYTAQLEQLKVNTVGPITLTNLLLPCLLNRTDSRLIFNSSVLGFNVLPFRGPYSVSKYALEAAADAYRLELSNTPVKVSIIQPGPIKTNFRGRAYNEMKACIGNARTRLVYNEHKKRLNSDFNKHATDPAVIGDIIVRILESDSPKARYRVTAQTHVANILAFLPVSIRDFIALTAQRVFSG